MVDKISTIHRNIICTYTRMLHNADKRLCASNSSTMSCTINFLEFIFFSTSCYLYRTYFHRFHRFWSPNLVDSVPQKS